jgi:hypothetical protein
LLAPAAFGGRRNRRIESDVSLERQPHNIVELQSQIRELQLRRQQFLLRLQQLCFTVDEIYFECATVLHLLYALTL